MTRQKIVAVLKIINRKLKNQKIKWVLVGSTSLALQGVKIKPKDIDILTDKEGAFRVNKLFKNYEVKPVEFGRLKIGGKELFESYLGKFKIKGVKVEIMGNLKEKLGRKWIYLHKGLKSPKIIEFQGMRLPVSPLKEQLKSYSRLGRKKDFIRVKKIKKALSIKLTKLGWDRAFEKEGKIFIKPHRDMARIAKFFKKEGIRKVLDLGCGSGRHLVYLAKRGFDAYGIDIARHGIKIARKWLKEKGLKANLKVGDIYKKLPYKNNFFDAIISIKTLHHEKIENIRKLIKEMKGILKPEGLIFITGHRKPPKKKIPKEKLYGIKFIAPRTYVTLAGPEKGMPHYIFNAKILKKEFRDFKIIELWIDDKGDYCLLGKLKKL
jgi:SAM-dependent methyltransferase